MDILLSHAYFLAEDEGIQTKPYPPLGLLYLSSHLKVQGFSVELFDSTFQCLTTFATFLQQERPNIVGLYGNVTTKPNLLKMVQLCKSIGAIVVLGGPEPTSNALAYLEYGADVVVLGEGEHTLTELIPRLTTSTTNLHDVLGIAFRDGDGEVVITPSRPLIEDLSAQPWPDREAVNMTAYLDVWRAHQGVSSISLITARGCRYGCTWCSHSVYGHTHRRRTPQDVADEVAWIAERYDPDQLWYADDVFTVDRAWFLAYVEEIKQRGLRHPFECVSRADTLDTKVVEALADLGCYRLWLGAESGSQTVLDRMKRQISIEDVQAKTHLLQTQGIEVGLFIMLGYEGEALADIQVTVDRLKQTNPDLLRTDLAYPIKGTPYYQLVEDKLVAPHNWEDYTDSQLQITGRHSRQFYHHTTQWMVNELSYYKLRQAKSLNLWRLTKTYLNAKWGRLGMYLTQHQREGHPKPRHRVRAWFGKEQATDFGK